MPNAPIFPTKDCRDCRWNQRARSREYDLCYSPRRGIQTGVKAFHGQVLRYADQNRIDLTAALHLTCGVAARWFEPKPLTRWQKIKKWIKKNWKSK